IARGAEKGDFAKQLGAHHYLDSTAVDVAEELTKLGGAATVLSTITNADATTAPLGGLRHRGQLVIVGVPEDPLNVPAVDLIMKSSSVAGHASGTAKDSEDTLRFAALTGVRPMVETAPLTDAASAFEKMMEGKARFRMVLTT
ncbi:zinc-binding dehydrogenase, partial [Oryzihumus sp.]|uniref:zinc-binding dehydrogenase n=1 Tax=Oryzihumus sp. TaxID=1968903 RepID=UPI002ED7B215